MDSACSLRGPARLWTDRICSEFDPAVTAERYVTQSIVPFAADVGEVARRGSVYWGPVWEVRGAAIGIQIPQSVSGGGGAVPAIDYHLRWDEVETLPEMYRDQEQARQDTAILHVHPFNWPRNIFFCCDPTDEPWHTSSERLRMKLSALGIPYEHDLETEGGGHGFGYYNKMADKAINFLVQPLDNGQRLRVNVTSEPTSLRKGFVAVFFL